MKRVRMKLRDLSPLFVTLSMDSRRRRMDPCTKTQAQPTKRYINRTYSLSFDIPPTFFYPSLLVGHA